VARPADLSQVLELLRSASEEMLSGVARLDDGAMSEASRLGGWTRGHVVSHLACNADSHVRRLEAAMVGEVVPQYEGGRSARNAAIEAGASHPAAAIVANLAASCDRLEQVLATFPDDAWEAEVEREYAIATAASLPFTRVIEVEVHHADLGVGFGAGDWPTAFVDRALPYVMERMAARAQEVSGTAASWHLHRTDGAGEWTIVRSAEGTSVRAEHAKADGAVRGPGHGLIAWLMGRLELGEAGLEVFGDADRATGFPALYPYG
jgi:maleylpyruvate isomerase